MGQELHNKSPIRADDRAVATAESRYQQTAFARFFLSLAGLILATTFLVNCFVFVQKQENNSIITPNLMAFDYPSGFLVVICLLCSGRFAPSELRPIISDFLGLSTRT